MKKRRAELGTSHLLFRGANECLDLPGLLHEGILQ